MEVPECPPTPPIVPLGLESPKQEMDSSSSKQDNPSPSRSASPDPNCAICLGSLSNKSFTDSCFHKFCFKCLLEWSKVKAECPLCKQKFKSIIHNVRSLDQYDQYDVQVAPHPPPSTEQAERVMLLTAWSMHPWFRSRRMATVRRPTSVLHMFDVLPSTHMTRSTTRNIMRRNLAASVMQPRTSGGLDRRRSIYANNLWAQPLPDITGRYRECSIQFYRSNPAMTHRLVPWISRDLSAICEPTSIAVALERINNLFMQYDIRSVQFSRELVPYLRDNTRHFVHELVSYARSPFDLTGYDRAVQHEQWYEGLDTHSVTDESDGSDHDVVLVSGPTRSSGSSSWTTAPSRYCTSSSSSSPVAGTSRASTSRDPLPGTSSTLIYNLHLLPGPSNSSNIFPETSIVEQSRVVPSSPFTISSDDEEVPAPTREGNDSLVCGSDVEVVAVLKPKRERTPEIITLDSSDEETVPQSRVEPIPTQRPSTSAVIELHDFSGIPLDFEGPSTSSLVDMGSSPVSSFFRSLDEPSSPSSSVKIEGIRQVDLGNTRKFYFSSGEDLSSDNLYSKNQASPETESTKKSKHRKHKKNMAPHDDSDSDDSYSPPLRTKKQVDCMCGGKKRKANSTEDRKKEFKRKHSKSRRTHYASPVHQRMKMRWSSDDSSNDNVPLITKLKSKVTWRIQDSKRASDQSSGGENGEIHRPRIKSIVVKRQPAQEASTSSALPNNDVWSRNRSSSSSSCEFREVRHHHKKSKKSKDKTKDKGKGKGKGKKKLLKD